MRLWTSIPMKPSNFYVLLAIRTFIGAVLEMGTVVEVIHHFFFAIEFRFEQIFR